MDKQEVAQAVLFAIGGRENVQYNTVCMTRLRVTLKDPSIVDYERLNGVSSVLGTAIRGNNGVEVVFGPRTIDGVYHAFVELTGVAPGTDALFPMSRQESSMRIQINPSHGADEPNPTRDSESLMDDEELSILDDLFGTDDDVNDEGEEPGPPREARLIVINGPNVNMIGVNPLEDTDLTDYPALLELCKDEAQTAGFARCDCYQSNHEGDLIDLVQDAYGLYTAMIVNPGWHMVPSPALCTAIRSVGIPTVVVNLFEPHDKPFPDLGNDGLIQSIAGLGVDGYREAIARLAERNAV